MFNYLGTREVENETGEKELVSGATTFDTLEEIKALDKHYHRGKSTFLASSLKEVTKSFEKSNRKPDETPRVLIVLTDGNLDENDEKALIAERDKIKKDKDFFIDEIFAIGVGGSYNEEVLKGKIATDIKSEDMKKTGVINVRRPQQLRLKVGDFLRQMCEAKGKQIKEKSDGNRDCGWLCQHRMPILPVMKKIQVRNNLVCNPRKQDSKYENCEYDSYSIFDNRPMMAEWDFEKCWCNSKNINDCFKKPCKCSSCDDNVDYKARCFNKKEPVPITAKPVPAGVINPVTAKSVTENADFTVSEGTPAETTTENVVSLTKAETTTRNVALVTKEVVTDGILPFNFENSPLAPQTAMPVIFEESSPVAQTAMPFNFEESPPKPTSTESPPIPPTSAVYESMPEYEEPDYNY